MRESEDLNVHPNDEATDVVAGPQAPVGLPTWPVAIRLWEWAATTGDDVATIARGFDLATSLVESLLSGKRVELALHEADLVCRRLRVDPIELWGPARASNFVRSQNIEPLFGEPVQYEAWPIPVEANLVQRKEESCLATRIVTASD